MVTASTFTSVMESGPVRPRFAPLCGNYADLVICAEGMRSVSSGLRIKTFEASVMKWARWGSNPRPKDYESPALTAELQALLIGCQYFASGFALRIALVDHVRCPCRLAKRQRMRENSRMGDWTQVGENLVRHKGGSYYLRAWVDGKVIRAKLDAANLRIAKLQRDAKLAAMRGAAKVALTSSVRTLDDAITVVSERMTGLPDLEEPTQEYYQDIIQILRRTMPLEAHGKVWSATEAAAWWKAIAKKYSPQRANNILSMGKRVGAVLVECGLCMDNPLGKFKRVKIPETKIIVPSRETADSIVASIAAQGKRDSKESAAYVGFLAYGGCRHGQAQALQWEDVDLRPEEKGGGWITFWSGVRGTKGAKSRRLPISVPLRKILEDYKPKDATGPVFKIKTPRIALDNACKRLEIPHLRLHDLRHFFSTYAIESGVDIPTVAKWLGHKDGGALLMKTYSHVRDDHSAASAKKLL
jgi:integrase